MQISYGLDHFHMFQANLIDLARERGSVQTNLCNFSILKELLSSQTIVMRSKPIRNK